MGLATSPPHHHPSHLPFFSFVGLALFSLHHPSHFLFRNEGFQFKASKEDFILIRVLDFDYGKQGAIVRYSKRTVSTMLSKRCLPPLLNSCIHHSLSSLPSLPCFALFTLLLPPPPRPVAAYAQQQPRPSPASPQLSLASAQPRLRPVALDPEPSGSNKTLPYPRAFGREKGFGRLASLQSKASLQP